MCKMLNFWVKNERDFEVSHVLCARQISASQILFIKTNIFYGITKGKFDHLIKMAEKWIFFWTKILGQKTAKVAPAAILSLIFTENRLKWPFFSPKRPKKPPKSH